MYQLTTYMNIESFLVPSLQIYFGQVHNFQPQSGKADSPALHQEAVEHPVDMKLQTNNSSHHFKKQKIIFLLTKTLKIKRGQETSNQHIL